MIFNTITKIIPNISKKAIITILNKLNPIVILVKKDNELIKEIIKQDRISFIKTFIIFNKKITSLII